ncbi:putative HTH-type transcriptional regulator LtrA [Pseudomonas reidholzensis]|uniref:Putative HTH-type transcriptional regulator LtrA n=1 Tax=Pseudomonas reidholzensis TaxID=1785162 RepID=A0A383RTG0_9PSED|nr:LysR substrate-binding domain-containing protein [Pseudomonas reidholzensis]SYX90342.1 putative HTH-type transcriptional regulator LtrA [Pseudomonas reidholzensis]
MPVSEHLKDIDFFVNVANAGSFVAAAERMHLTSSAVSKGVARLEKRLQVRLFERTTRRLLLSDAGTRYYRTCTRVLADIEEAELALHDEQKEPCGKLRIDLPASFGRLHALPAVLAFAQRHPRLQPHITLSDRFVDLAEDAIDIVVRIGGPHGWAPGIEHRYLGSQRLVFCASPGYLAAHGTPGDEQALRALGCVLYACADGSTPDLHFAGSRQGVDEMKAMPGRLAIGDGEGQAMAIMAGHGIAQLPTWLVQRQLDEGTLVQVLPGFTSEGLPIHLAWRRSRGHLPKVSALVEALSERLTPLLDPTCQR